MPFKVTVDMPSLAEDGEVYIPGLGALVRGDNYIADDAAVAYQQANLDHEPAYVTNEDGSLWEDENGNNEQVGVQQVLVPFEELVARYAGLSAEEVSEDDIPVDPEVQAEADKAAAEAQKQEMLNLDSNKVDSKPTDVNPVDNASVKNKTDDGWGDK